jgi:predicted SnoaL-like aldol condensation-catalyzing enzyme
MRMHEDHSVGTTTPHKEAATEFLRLASKGDVTRAYDTYVSEDFRHHNPYFRGDAGSLAKAMKDNAVQNPEKQLTVERVIEEGDLVMVHSRVRHNASSPEAAVVHIFRFDGDRIAELWDVGQEAPSDSPNQYGMF